MNINERISSLRKIMLEKGISACFVPSSDYHMSEYINDYFKERQFITGFTGSAGEALITLDKAYLWTDSRYFLQAENQLKGSEVILQKLGVTGTVTPLEMIKSIADESFVLCVDKRCISTRFGKSLQGILKTSIVSEDLIDLIYEDRPQRSETQGFVLPVSITGKSTEDKLIEIRKKMAENVSSCVVLSSLDDIMWLMNIRGGDIAYNPVLLSYLIIREEDATIYLQHNSLNNKLVRYLSSNKVSIKEYNDIYEDVKEIKNQNVVVDEGKLNFALYDLLNENNTLINANFVTLEKACKNKVEQNNAFKAHLKDGIAVTKFIYYVKHTKEENDELSMAEKLHSFRKEQPDFIEDSFAPIVGWAGHGAIVHYSATKETSAKITKDSLLLVDSGGQYLQGTTDVTRTILIGKASKQMKDDFTLVLKDHLRLLDCEFNARATGADIDAIGRSILWKQHKEYGHGTGHGVGHLLNVHEGPNGICYSRGYAAFKEGMITSNEPGLYIEGQYGIRHESLVLSKVSCQNEFGTFMKFVPLTLAPFDLDAINKRMLTKEEKRILNNYHKNVYKKLVKHLTPTEARWLKHATRAI